MAPDEALFFGAGGVCVANPPAEPELFLAAAFLAEAFFDAFTAAATPAASPAAAATPAATLPTVALVVDFFFAALEDDEAEDEVDVDFFAGFLLPVVAFFSAMVLPLSLVGGPVAKLPTPGLCI